MNGLPEIMYRDGIRTVNARELHEKLQVKTGFKDWIKRRVDVYGFSEGVDFCSSVSESTGGRPNKEYYISIDMAKELCMVENNENGRKIRRLFIEIEKAYRQSVITESSKNARKGVCRAWAEHGAEKPHHFINLTRETYKAIFGTSSIKKKDMNTEQILRLQVIESLETYKLFKHPETNGYYALKDSVIDTATNPVNAISANTIAIQ